MAGQAGVEAEARAVARLLFLALTMCSRRGVGRSWVSKGSAKFYVFSLYVSWKTIKTSLVSFQAQATIAMSMRIC